MGDFHALVQIVSNQIENRFWIYPFTVSKRKKKNKSKKKRNNCVNIFSFSYLTLLEIKRYNTFSSYKNIMFSN